MHGHDYLNQKEVEEMNVSRVCLIALAALIASSASAAITPIGEFTGDMYEGFESVLPLGGHPSPIDVFGGQATFDDIIAHSIQIANSLYSFPNDTYIFPYNGNLMGGSVTGWAAFEFDQPVLQFGAYIGTTDILTGGTAAFFDEGGQQLDSVPVTIGLGEWVWYGWESDVPMKRIEIKGSTTIGQPLTFDDMQATVPEPTALSLIAMGAACLLRRRR